MPLAPMLIAMCGLPGSGKSALAEDLGGALAAPVLSVDPIEAALWQSGITRDQPTGLAAYVVAETLAAEQLKLGMTVIIDAVNDVPEARGQWEVLAAKHAVPLRFIEVHCSDPDVHRRRLSRRVCDPDGFPEPTWSEVQARRSQLEAWSGHRLVIDSMKAREENLATALVQISVA